MTAGVLARSKRSRRIMSRGCNRSGAWRPARSRAIKPPPIVNNGVMFAATPGNQMLAIEAKTGNILWRYKRALPENVVHLHPTNRGVALYGYKVYFASADCVLVALDVKTGKEVWTAKVDDYKKAYYTSLAPLVVDGKVLLGASGRSEERRVGK